MIKKKKVNMKVQWAKCIVVSLLYLLFLYWVESWWGLIVLPFIYDAYISQKIKWQWWKDAEGPTRFVMSWVDALVFALVAVYFINLLFPELRHTVKLVGEITADGRLPLRLKGQLRTEDSTNTADNAADTAHAAGVRM